ncbi:MAG: heme exporter protein CcmB [Bacteroidota bacterium]
MDFARKVGQLVLLEVKLEWKNKQSITALLIYSLASIFVTYLAFQQTIDLTTWNSLFWIILLFASTNAIAKSFLQDSKGLQLFYYSMLSPKHLILAKIIYNLILLSGLSFINFLIFKVIFPIQIEQTGQYLLSLLLGAIGLATILTLVAGIVSKANNNAALLAILGFPLLFPLLSITIQCSMNAINGFDWIINQQLFIVLISLNLITVLLSYLLFPYLWRE